MQNQNFAADVEKIGKIEVVRQILEVVCRTTGLRFSTVARVTESNWVACAVRDELGFGVKAGEELAIDTTLCAQVRLSDSVIAFDHAEKSALFCGHPTPQMYGFQSFVSVPIRLPDGRFFGTLCALDALPADVENAQTVGMFRLFADLIGQHLDAQERLAASEAALQRERETAAQRERFIAVLGHDLRNPLSAINAGIEVLHEQSEAQSNAPILDVMRRSSSRINGLINDVLDFTRSRLGIGLTVNRRDETRLQEKLQQVVTELALTAPGRVIESDWNIEGAVFCDGARLAQMLSNLVANAISYGAPNAPIRVRGEAHSEAGGYSHGEVNELQIAVTNVVSQAIEPRVLEQIFEPFSPRSNHSEVEGLGLGLYIAAEIARAHGGRLKVDANGDKVCFTFLMPRENSLD